MARQRTIIGIGEALLAEYPDHVEPAGLAIDIARAAMKLGHRGIPISRLGQDNLANEMLTQLTAMKVDQSHIQSDPDLPTGRLIVRSIAGQRKETLDHRAAFDNLQWDFDLVDVGHEADAVVFGVLAQRGGQSSSVIARFLCEAQGALVCCDLLNRADEAFERMLAVKSLELAQIAIIDTVAWSILRWGARDVPHDEAANRLMRECELAAVVWIDPNHPLEVHSAEGSFKADSAVEKQLRATAIVAILHAMLRGDDTSRVVQYAEHIVTHARKNPDAEVPERER